MPTTIDSKPVQKLISDLQSIGITFEFDQEETDMYNFDGVHIGKRKLENVVFRKNDAKLKISFLLFFRHSGLSCIMDSKKSNKKGEENYVKLIVVTDDMFYSMERQSIERSLKIKTGEIKIEDGKV